MFAGTFEQALNQLRITDRATIKSFIQYMDAHPNTVGGWLFGTSIAPTGETKIRILSYFKLNDWRITEFESLEPLAQELALLLGYRVMTLAQILDELGLAQSYGSGILGFLYGEKELTKRTRKLAQLVVAQKANDLMSTEKQLKEQFGFKKLDQQLERPSTVSSSKHSTIVRLAEILKEAYPLAIALNSDNFTDEQRAEMRKLVGPENYVQLSVTLAQMKSARTRLQHRGAR